MVYETPWPTQLKLDLDCDQTSEYVQYHLNLVDRNDVPDNKKIDHTIKRYAQVFNVDQLPNTCPEHYTDERIDLKGLEPGAEYYEIKDFFTKHKLLHSALIPADDVLIAKGPTTATSLPRWAPYTTVVNWYIDNQSTVYQHYEDQEIIDQFFPDNLSLWILDLNYNWTTQSLDQSTETRTWITWLYKTKNFNQLLTEWSSHNK